MAIALVVLAIGSVLAGYIGIPHALGGSNALGTWLEPAFEAHQSTGLAASMTLADCDPLKPDTTTAAGRWRGWRSRVRGSRRRGEGRERERSGEPPRSGGRIRDGGPADASKLATWCADLARALRRRQKSTATNNSS
jgi:hypothetical protein